MQGLAKLNTGEDPYGLHKSLGVFALLHYCWRFARVGRQDMGFGPTAGTLVCLLLHAALSCSSLVFSIPQRRIKEGSRIWPEYRLHSIIFALRSLAYLLLLWAERVAGAAEPWHCGNVAIVFGALLAADAASRSCGEEFRSRTIRDMDVPNPLLQFGFSCVQLHATTAILLGTRRFSAQFVILLVIQFTAFMMTLRRKNIVSHEVWVGTYGAILASGFAVCTYDVLYHNNVFFFNALGNTMCLLRFGALRVNKYRACLPACLPADATSGTAARCPAMHPADLLRSLPPSPLSLPASALVAVHLCRLRLPRRAPSRRAALGVARHARAHYGGAGSIGYEPSQIKAHRKPRA